VKKVKFRKSPLIFSIFILVVSFGLYLLADRYLIQHVELVNANAPGISSIGINDDSDGFVSEANSIHLELPESNVTLNDMQESADNVKFDDWNYQGEGKSIAIKEVVFGNGTDQVTYFVAEVQLDHVTSLKSAFAENEFGTNIIDTTSNIAKENNAIFAINGDYYGFREDGILIRNGIVYRDIPARTGLAIYLDGSMKIYDETQTDAQTLIDAGVWQTLSFGPALIENSKAIENISKIEIDSNFGNHSIQGNNPRTGIGIIDENHFVFVVVDGRSKGYSRGVTLSEFSQIFLNLGCTSAYNIDGGGSSTMFFMGKLINNPLGRNKERGTSDILFIN